MKFTIQMVLGNFATTFWFLPPLSKLIHKLRGVNIQDPKSLFLSRGVVLDNKYPELINIAPDVWLTQKVMVLTHSSVSEFQKIQFGLEEKVASVYIQRGVFVGVGSIILPGVTVGEGSFIAAGSVVTKNIPPGVIAGGNPCKIIGHFTKAGDSGL